MIPRTYPTDSSGAIRVYLLPSTSGLTKWVDYIPVKENASSGASLNTYNNAGAILSTQIGSESGSVRWKDHVPVYIVVSGTVWGSGEDGYIPLSSISAGAGTESLDFSDENNSMYLGLRSVGGM